MGGPDGMGKGGIESVIESLWLRVLSRGMSLVGWPLLGFFAWQLWGYGEEFVKAQGTMAQTQRDQAYDIREVKRDLVSCERRLDNLERADRRRGRDPRPSQPETP